MTLGPDTSHLSSGIGNWYANNLEYIIKVEYERDYEFAAKIFGSKESYTIREARIRYLKVR